MENINRENSAIFKIPGFMFELAANMEVEGVLDAKSMVMMHDTYTFEQPVSYQASITNTGEAFTVVGRANAVGQVACARCLENVEHVFDCDFDVYVLNPESGEADLDPSAYVAGGEVAHGKRGDCGVSADTECDDDGKGDVGSSFEGDEYDVLPKNHELDLTPYIESALRLSAPAMPLCKDDCKGLCARCGANLNVETCNCNEVAEQEALDDSPFAVLKGLNFDK